MCRGARHETGQKYRSRLIRHFPDGNDTVQVCQQGSKKTETNYSRAHWISDNNNIGRKTYGEGCNDGLGGIAIDGEKY